MDYFIFYLEGEIAIGFRQRIFVQYLWRNAKVYDYPGYPEKLIL
jgi:hypothetical protein